MNLNLAKKQWQATHHIYATGQGGREFDYFVMVVAGEEISKDFIGYRYAYTKTEWEHEDVPCWCEVNGEWRFDGSLSYFDKVTVIPLPQDQELTLTIATNYDTGSLVIAITEQNNPDHAQGALIKNVGETAIYHGANFKITIERIS